MDESQKLIQRNCLLASLVATVLLIWVMLAFLPVFAANEGQAETTKIVVGGDYNYPPYEFIDETGEPAGYNVELTRAIAETMGFDVEIRLRPWWETRRALEDGDIDAIHGMFYSKERENRFDFSAPHTVIHHAVFARRDASPIKSLEDLRGKDIIVMRDDIMHDFVLEAGLSHNVTLAETQADALRQLAAGKHDYALIAKLPGFHWINELNLSNIVAVGPPILPAKYSYAVKDGNAEVLALFSEGLAMLEESGRHKEIYDKWLGVLELQGIPKRMILKYAAIIVTPFVLMLFGLWFWSWSLRKQVALRTVDLTREIAERKLAEEALREAQNNLEQRVEVRTTELVQAEALSQSVIDGISEPLVMLDENLIVKMANEAALKYYDVASYKDVMGKNCYKVLRGEDSVCENCYVSLVMSDGEKITLNRAGLFDPSRLEQVTVYPVKGGAGEVSGCVLRISDVTEQKDIERQMVRADRLSSLGQLSGGIAHEIRNPLSGISLFVDLLCDEDRYERADQELEILQDIKNNINKIDGIIRRILDFARVADVEAELLDVNYLIQDNLKLWYAKTRKAEIELKLSLEEDLPAVFGDAIEIQQVVLNLMQNAVDAMSNGGVLTISTSKGVSSFHPGRPVVVIKLQDTGDGIDAKLQGKIFNPFFSTKASGTGLGLSISHQIVERHGGIITFDSKSGRGTTFTVELPAAQVD